MHRVHAHERSDVGQRYLTTIALLTHTDGAALVLSTSASNNDTRQICHRAHDNGMCIFMLLRFDMIVQV